jgi:hypothetical protein
MTSALWAHQANVGSFMEFREPASTVRGFGGQRPPKQPVKNARRHSHYRSRIGRICGQFKFSFQLEVSAASKECGARGGAVIIAKIAEVRDCHSQLSRFVRLFPSSVVRSLCASYLHTVYRRFDDLEISLLVPSE